MFGTVLSRTAQTALALLGKANVLPPETYLAGGTALALHFGHRKSEDLDFFTPSEFDPIALHHALSSLGECQSEFAKGMTLLGVFNGVKFSCFRYDYPLIGACTSYEGIRVASPDDIVAMKLVAIMDRATKRDYVDLFEFHRHGMTIEQMFALYDTKYHFLETNRFSLIKALGYLDDADVTKMPEMLVSIRWEDVKTFFASESLRLARQWL